MTQGKFIRLLNEFLTKLGDVDVVQYIDYYYRETYDGALNWKVRKVIKLSDLINLDITPVTDLGSNFNGRDLLKFLDKYEQPFKVSVKYDDSYARWKQQNEDNADKEQAKLRFINEATKLLQPYSMPPYSLFM
jgi:hypothetical protein